MTMTIMTSELTETALQQVEAWQGQYYGLYDHTQEPSPIVAWLTKEDVVYFGKKPKGEVEWVVEFSLENLFSVPIDFWENERSSLYSKNQHWGVRNGQLTAIDSPEYEPGTYEKAQKIYAILLPWLQQNYLWNATPIPQEWQDYLKTLLAIESTATGPLPPPPGGDLPENVARYKNWFILKQPESGA